VQVEALAEVFAVGCIRDKPCPQPVQPEQRFFAQRINVVDIFEIKNTGCSRTKVAGDSHEFLGPISCQPAFQNEYRRIVACW
jgi:hypothetical protein